MATHHQGVRVIQLPARVALLADIIITARRAPEACARLDLCITPAGGMSRLLACTSSLKCVEGLACDDAVRLGRPSLTRQPLCIGAELLS